MKKIALTFLIGTLAWLEPTLAISTVQSEHGFLSVNFMTGYQESRLMNSDGTLASYKGFQGGLGIDIKVWSADTSEIRLFGSYLMAEAAGDPSDNKLKTTQSLLGVKVYPSSWIFLAAGMGRASCVSSAPITSDKTLSASTTGIGGGIEFPLSGNWFWSVSGWYTSGAIKQSDNASYTGNSAFDGAQLQLSVIWSPPSTTINITGK